MTLYEYRMRKKAYRLMQLDREYEIHMQAWANWCVKSMKNVGRNKRVPVYKTFKQFFDYEKYLRKEIGSSREKSAEDEKKRRIARMVKQQRERRKSDGKL